MSIGEYANAQRRLGESIVERDGIHWRRVRPFFYRPVLPVESFPRQKAAGPRWPLSFQYAVNDEKVANSQLSFVILDDLASYSIDRVSTRRRYLIKQGARRFSVRRIESPEELKRHGHRVYLSFLQRTGYAYKADRRDSEKFNAWVDTLFSTPKVVVLGGFGEAGLSGVSTSYWVGSTLVLATFFGESDAMKQNVGEVMLHELRSQAAKQAGLKEIYLRSYQGGNSLDRYYLIRDAKLIHKPARLEMPRPLQWFMRLAVKDRYQQLLGSFHEQQPEKE